MSTDHDLDLKPQHQRLLAQRHMLSPLTTRKPLCFVELKKRRRIHLMINYRRKISMLILVNNLLEAFGFCITQNTDLFC